MLGKSIRITGEIIVTGEKLNGTIRIHEATPKSVNFTALDIEPIINAMAIFILKNVEPTTVATYQFNEFNKSVLESIRGILRDTESAVSEKAHAYNLWGLLFRREKQYEKAFSMFMKAVETDPQPGWYVNWANLLIFDYRKPDEAIRLLANASVSKRHPVILAYLGHSIARTKQVQRGRGKI